MPDYRLDEDKDDKLEQTKIKGREEESRRPKEPKKPVIRQYLMINTSLKKTKKKLKEE